MFHHNSQLSQYSILRTYVTWNIEKLKQKQRPGYKDNCDEYCVTIELVATIPASLFTKCILHVVNLYIENSKSIPIYTVHATTVRNGNGKESKAKDRKKFTENWMK